MEIIFNVKCYDENRILTEGEKELYKQIVYSLCNKSEQVMDLSLLKNIIITENYKEELFEFQRQNNHEEFLTDNEYGQGWAQVVSNIDENGKLNYSVLIKKELILAIVPDIIMDENAI